MFFHLLNLNMKKHSALNLAFLAPWRFNWYFFSLLSVVQSFLSSCLCGKNAFAFAFSADPSLTSADPHFGGGHTGAIRGTCVISADLAEPSAMQKYQFGGFSRASRLSFRRMKLHFVHLLHF